MAQLTHKRLAAPSATASLLPGIPDEDDLPVVESRRDVPHSCHWQSKMDQQGPAEPGRLRTDKQQQQQPEVSGGVHVHVQ
jgi:hypothetical protein